MPKMNISLTIEPGLEALARLLGVGPSRAIAIAVAHSRSTLSAASRCTWTGGIRPGRARAFFEVEAG